MNSLVFEGSLDDLKQAIGNMGYGVQEVKEVGNGHQLKLSGGAIVNWFPSTGKIQAQGPPQAQASFREKWAGQPVVGQAGGQAVAVLAPAMKTKVFVVHGHDTQAREQLELILFKLGLKPFVLQNTSGNGETIIEALERHISGPDAAEFGIVLMTPDDIGYKKGEEANAQPRARQNVVLEMGMLISALGRARVAILKKGHLDPPSDVSGYLYIPFNDHVKETVSKLVPHLRSAGFEIDGVSVTDASS